MLFCERVFGVMLPRGKQRLVPVHDTESLFSWGPADASKGRNGCYACTVSLDFSFEWIYCIILYFPIVKSRAPGVVFQ